MISQLLLKVKIEALRCIVTLVDVVIDCRVLGSEKHLSLSSDGAQWIQRIPSDSWHLSGAHKLAGAKCFDTLLRLGGHEACPQVPEKHRTAMSHVAPDLDAPPWRHILPPTLYKEHFDSLLKVAGTLVDPSHIRYYEDVWHPCDQLLSALRPAKVDAAEVDRRAADSVHNSSVVASFRPRSGGYAPPIVYDRFGTVTGRLTVASGPSILHLKREHRSMLKSSFSGGKIMSLDFSSLEARILLYESGGECDGPDLYTSLGNQLGGIPRHVIKGAVLADLYGSSKNALALSLGLSDTVLKDFIKKIGEVIDTRSLLARLKAQHATEGYITNKHGRRICVSRPQDNIFINYYAQSTGVDVALLGFKSIVDSLGSDGVRPLFVLHDALILDVRDDRVSDVRSIVDVSIAQFEQKFPIKCEDV